MTVRVEFGSLELTDFGPFGGSQAFSFARAPVGGRCGLTLVTGAGGSGKTSLITALKLALWGARYVDNEYAMGHGGPGDGESFTTDWRRYVHAGARRGLSPLALLRLTLHVGAVGPAASTMVITRSLQVSRHDSVVETLSVETAGLGEPVRHAAEDPQDHISSLLPPRRLTSPFWDCESIETLADLASLQPRLRGRAINEVNALVGVNALERLQDVAPAVIEFGNRLLACGGEEDAPKLLPGADGGRRVCPILPGLWISREPTGATELTCVGSALVLGLHLSSDIQTPLVLDAPTLRMPPDYSVAFLEALSEVARSQVIIAAHEDSIDDLTVHMWERAHRVYLVEPLRGVCCTLLNEPMAGCERS